MLLITSVLSGCAHVSLSTATIYGVLGVGSDSSDVKGPYSLCGVYREPRTLLSRSYFRFVGVGRWGRKEGTGYFLEENGVGGEGIIHCN